jgi:glutamate-1-semialdehyde 2,1-aminomutase
MDKENILSELVRIYTEKHRKSKAHYNQASQYQIRGGSHNLRLFEPYPFFDVHCEGSKVIDVDGNTYVDFWQGHFANILGHNPKIVLDALIGYFQKNQGLTTGFPSMIQKELAEIILKYVDADKIRFTTSGALATMYSIMLSKAYTKRDLILKVGGGWHGANPYVLKGISDYGESLNQIESAGLPQGMDFQILMTKFNDIEDLRQKFSEFGEHIACFIIEPFIGAGGFIFSDKQYLMEARSLTSQYNSILIFDEVISGFRFHTGGVQSLYGIRPELSIFGKAIGGGMPVSAVAGRNDIMELCSPGGELVEKVKFEGGTFSAHPSSMLAGSTFIKYLVEHEKDIYPRMGKLGAKVRKAMEEIFAKYGFNVKCTGYGDSIIQNSSIVGVHFLKDGIERIISPEQVWNPNVCDFELREKIFKLAMLNEGFNIFHGYGAISAAHSEEEIQDSLDAVERIAKKWTK